MNYQIELLSKTGLDIFFSHMFLRHVFLWPVSVAQYASTSFDRRIQVCYSPLLPNNVEKIFVSVEIHLERNMFIPIVKLILFVREGWWRWSSGPAGRMHIQIHIHRLSIYFLCHYMHVLIGICWK